MHWAAYRWAVKTLLGWFFSLHRGDHGGASGDALAAGHQMRQV